VILAILLADGPLSDAWLRSHGCRSDGMSGEGDEEEGGVNNGEWSGVNKGEEGGANWCRVSPKELGEQFTLDPCSLSAAEMTGTNGLEGTPLGTGDLDCGATNVSNMEILFFLLVES